MGLDRLVAGDTLDFVDTIPDYPPADGWTLKYRLTPRFTTPAQTPITLTATTSGTDYRIQASPATTAAWSPGIYAWARWVEKGGARQTLDPLVPGLELLADPSTAAQGYDPRTPARAALDAANAGLAAYGTSAFSNVVEYSIAGRSMRFREFRDQNDFLDFRSQLQFEVWSEDARTAMAAGKPNPRQIRVRMARA
jgi:hypothetical protein